MRHDAAVSFNSITLNMNLEIILKVNYYHLGVILNLDCPLSDSVLHEFSDQLVFNETYVWLLLTTAPSPPSNRLRHLPLSIDTETTVATRDGNKFTLYDIWNPSYRHNGLFHVVYKGRWSPEEGLINELTQYKYTRRNFNLTPLNFSITLRHPPLPDLETYMTTPINPQFDSMHRYHYALALILRDIFNFTINLHRASSWGYMKPDKTFDGILGDIAKKVIDISISPFRYRPERFDVAEFTVQTLLVRSFFIFRHPSSASLRNNFLKPFANELWWMILMVSIVYWISLLITIRIQKHYDESRSSLMVPASEATLTTVAALSQQGVSDDPQIISGRIVFLSLFIWGLLLFQFYSASIVGSLLTTPPHTITTVKNLTDSDIDCGAEDVAWAYDMFKTTPIAEESELYEKKIKPFENTPKNKYFSIVKGMQKVQKGGFAFYTESAPAYKQIKDTYHEDEICELQEIQSHPAREVTMVTAKHSPFTKMVIYGLRKIVQHGLSAHVLETWYAPRPRCPETHNSKPTAVKFEQFVPAIFLLLMGMSVSIFVLGIEYLYFYQTEDASHFHQEYSARATQTNPTPEHCTEEY
ncbi:probable glutamate receptor [Diachasma alloeum]|uniref:Ionotropic receptor 64a.2 n=1 Tax=Diachasma alloeum TaxID=454923 RepID=A0A4E0S3U9_9HYME|nr:probable glutamate receptor [Diachasma alloeum]THK33135.1 ionotropic receptor 64a.2 [Diachasma alloeum]